VYCAPHARGTRVDLREAALHALDTAEDNDSVAHVTAATLAELLPRYLADASAPAFQHAVALCDAFAQAH
jgi:hypothetical protein